MRNDRGRSDPKATTGTGESPVAAEVSTTTEKPGATGPIPTIGADQAAKKLEAQIPGVDTDASAKSHDKGHLQAERGFMPQHGKASQPQPRWNLPRR